MEEMQSATVTMCVCVAVCHGKTNIKLRNLSESSHCLALFGLHKREKFARNCDCFSSHIRARITPDPFLNVYRRLRFLYGVFQQRSILLFFFSGECGKWSSDYYYYYFVGAAVADNNMREGG